MEVPSYIDKELSLINPKYFAVFDRQKKRWRVRKWDSMTRRRNWRENSEAIFTVKKENAKGDDIGYSPIDMRTVATMRLGFYNARNAVRLLQEIDAANDSIVRKGDAETDYLMRNGAKRIWHNYQEPSVYMNQKYSRHLR